MRGEGGGGVVRSVSPARWPHLHGRWTERRGTLVHVTGEHGWTGLRGCGGRTNVRGQPPTLASSVFTSCAASAKATVTRDWSWLAVGPRRSLLVEPSRCGRRYQQPSVHTTRTGAKKKIRKPNESLVVQQQSRFSTASGGEGLMNHINHGPVEKAQCKKQRRQHHHGDANAASTSRQRCAADEEQHRQCGTH